MNGQTAFHGTGRSIWLDTRHTSFGWGEGAHWIILGSTGDPSRVSAF